MIQLLTSDDAILLFSCVGLLLTAVSIVRDTRAQRDALAVTPDIVRPLPPEERRAA